MFWARPEEWQIVYFPIIPYKQDLLLQPYRVVIFSPNFNLQLLRQCSRRAITLPAGKNASKPRWPCSDIVLGISHLLPITATKTFSKLNKIDHHYTVYLVLSRNPRTQWSDILCFRPHLATLALQGTPRAASATSSFLLSCLASFLYLPPPPHLGESPPAPPAAAAAADLSSCNSVIAWKQRDKLPGKQQHGRKRKKKRIPDTERRERVRKKSGNLHVWGCLPACFVCLLRRLPEVRYRCQTLCVQGLTKVRVAGLYKMSKMEKRHYSSICQLATPLLSVSPNYPTHYDEAYLGTVPGLSPSLPPSRDSR
jgi:hypothetical protein